MKRDPTPDDRALLRASLAAALRRERRLRRDLAWLGATYDAQGQLVLDVARERAAMRGEARRRG